MQQSMSMNNAAHKLGIGPKVLFRVLRNAGILHADGPCKNSPNSYQISLGHFTVRLAEFQKGRVKHTVNKTLVTPKGLIYLQEFLGALEKSGQLPHYKRVQLPHQQNAPRLNNEVHGMAT